MRQQRHESAARGIPFHRLASAVVMLLGLLPPVGANAADRPGPASVVWPAPPQEPRIGYVQSIVQPADLGLKSSGLGRFFRWVIGVPKGSEKFIKPFGVALDEVDNLCLTDTGANAVCFFDAAQKRWYRWDHVGKTRFVSPVAVAKRRDILFVADSALRRVLAFNIKGKLVFEINSGLVRPSGLAVSGENLFVVDSQLCRIMIFDLRGKLLSQFGSRGDGPGEFNFPTHVAVSPQGELLVTDSLNGRIQVFDLQGRFKARVGSAGDSPGHFGRPKGAAADSFGRVYVVDSLFDNLQVFERDGGLLLSLGEPGAGPGEFWLPNGIAISRDNRIFVADSYNRRIQVLKYIGGR